MPQEERAVDPEAAQEVVQVGWREARRGTLGGRPHLVGQVLVVDDAESDRLRRDLLQDRDQREDHRPRLAEQGQVPEEVAELLLGQVVPGVPGDYHVEAHRLRAGEELGEELRAGLLAVAAAHPAWGRTPDRRPWAPCRSSP